MSSKARRIAKRLAELTGEEVTELWKATGAAVAEQVTKEISEEN